MNWAGIFKKLGTSLLTVFIAMLFTFFLVRSMPGDPIHTRAEEIVREQNIPYEMAYNIAKDQYNYDPAVSLPEQFIKYIKGLLKGNLGESILFRIPVTDIIFNALPWTLFIVSLALLTSFILGCFLGLFITWKRQNRWLEGTVTFISVVTQSIPDFLVALLFLVIFSVRLQWFPIHGAYSVETTPGFNFSFIISALYHAILPVAAFTMYTVGTWTLAMKASATSVMTEDYMNVARAKGLKQERILVRYLGKNAVMPLVTSLAISFGTMLSGAMFIEAIFSYPGVGYFFGVSIQARDFILMQGLLLLTTLAIVLANFFADLFYAWIDPRVKLE
ncbi:ABC transporter permease [Candidatus Riflebacteria bacterium]